MPGLLSNIFDGDDAASGTGAAGDGQESSTSSHALGIAGDGGVHLDPNIHIHSEMGGSYETPDSTQHDWSSSNDIALHGDVGAALGALVGAEQDDFDSAA